VARLSSFVLLGILLSGADLAADTVQGYVVEAGTGRRCASAEVGFLLVQNGRRSEVLHKSTDPEGRFAFTGPFITPGLTFALEARYQGVPYPSSELRVGEQSEVLLEVFEPTADDGQVRIKAHQLFLALGASGIEAAQFVEIENQGERAYVGVGEGESRRVTGFIVPQGASGFQSTSGTLAEAGPGRLFDSQPLPPGLTQLSFTYELDPQELPGAYVHQASYPTALLEVFLAPSTIQPGPPFTDLGVVNIQERQYRRVRLDNLARGQQVRIALPVSRSLRWVLKWAALGSLLLVVVAVLAAARRPRSAVAAQRQALEQQRQDLLRRLAGLEDAHAGGQDDPQFRAAQDRLIGQLEAVYRLLEGRDERR
jgi:hypothetical protein